MLFLDQSFQYDRVNPEQMDALWAQGWRHFGTSFFRYQLSWHAGTFASVIPLRIDLERFARSRSQKRVLARNRDVRVVIRDTSVDEAKQRLFFSHVQRFRENVPTSLYDFLSDAPATIPCRNHEICVYEGDRLLAVSFLDLGSRASSAVYAMFDPEQSRRSLGIFTMLTAIRYSTERGFRYYYHGYAYREPSFYDYKKNFSGLEYFDWQGGWHPFSQGNGDRDER